MLPSQSCMEEPAFDDLRTKKQLGYVAYGRTIPTKYFSLESNFFPTQLEGTKKKFRVPPLVKG